MSGADSVMWSLERNWDMVRAALDGSDAETKANRPADHFNCIAWIFWHINRVVDNFIHPRLQPKPELWVRDGWHLKFGMDERPRVMGRSPEDLTAWQTPSLQAQMGYFEAVKADAREYIPSLSNEDSERRVTFAPPAETRDHSVATALGQLVWDNAAHGGQIAYRRGLYTGMGRHR